MSRLLRASALALALMSGAALSVAVQPATAVAAEAAPDATAARGFVSDLAGKAFSTLRDTKLSAAQRDANFRGLLRQGFDLDYIARLLLGQYNNTATKAQLDAYYKVFPDYILTVYVSRLSDYANDTLTVTGATPAGKSDLYIRSELKRKKGEPVLLDWRVRQGKDGQMRIIDVKVEGVSLTVTQRSEFASRISSAGMDALIADLKAGVSYDAKSR